ncbi:TerB family tellurite resistance protein [Dinghuibacter silviterrae]|uniref:TerB family tellurite resistance protein n=1 Tax=Dinghuibacter silviterrae TaxID=1539049 RepID=A0A4R8DHU4_9BACT|nr:TerB family tellurite resistance protein [Dinghuibacter silviterrae]TDW97107.1 hypothetical protein EDB95_4948 [Dinghuibacter silviterrae]
MKHLLILLLIPLALVLPVHRAQAQAQELEQLALDLEKLSQLKSILKEMYTGYQILTGGYNTVKDLAKGNFNLHSAYLNSLLAVSPTIRQYVRVADIISAQATLMAECKSARSTFQGSGQFSADELNHLVSVYGNLVDKSLNNIDELTTVLTDNSLRMSDAERLTAIDHIYDDMQQKLSFLRSFNNRTGTLAAQRVHGIQDNASLQQLFQP